MPNSYTANYSWILPEVGADTNEWGAHLNTNFQSIDTKIKAIETASSGTAYVPISGATMTGFLTLNANPTSELHAATKGYVDSIASGSSTPYLPLTGGTLSGALTVNSTLNVSSTITVGSAGSWNTTTGAVTTTGNISTTTGSISAFGNILTSGGAIGTNGGGITFAGVISGTSLNVGTGAITSGLIASSGQVSGTSFTTTGAMNANAKSYFNNGIHLNYTGSQQSAFWLYGTSTSVNMSYGGDKFSFNSTGNAFASTSWSIVSDERQKTDIETIQNALGIVKNMRGVSYKWKESGIDGIGVIAQEMQSVVPQVVSEGPNGYYGVSYGNLVGVLIEAIKQLEARVAQLEA